MSVVIEKAQFGEYEISIETGRIAKQAAGAVIVRCGDSVVLVTVGGEKEARPGAGFFPLTVEYREGQFAAGKIPGGFFKREGRPAGAEILTCRIIDRPIRPLFPDGYLCETQIYAQPLSADPNVSTDILALIGASAALSISPIPWEGPIGGVRIGRIDGKFVANPSHEQLASSDMDIILAASNEAIVMVEGEADEITEAEMIDALLFGQDILQPILEMQARFAKKAGKEKWEYEAPEFNDAFVKKMKKQFGKQIDAATQVAEKKARGRGYKQLGEEIHTWFEESLGEEEYAEARGDIQKTYDKLKKQVIRQRIIKEGKRIDGRGLRDVRAIEIETNWLPRVHGSAVFQRGETQAMVSLTLGSKRDEQRIESYHGTEHKNFMLHYNFPAYSVGEVRPIRGPGRREIGHGHLAERSLARMAPSREEFPYTIRLVSDITESNGSSSMASVCGGSLALMSAGVPMKAAVAGIAMGLIEEGKDVEVLTDILGDEDHLGDMDFKVTGTSKGICAIQMDVKISGLSKELMERALEQAREGRLHILDEMNKSVSDIAGELSQHAPRMHSFKINVDRIRDLIGPGGKTIKSICEETGVSIDIGEDGTVTIMSPDVSSADKALQIVESITQDVEVNKIYLGSVKSIKEFGAFVEVLPGQEGLLHITEIHSEHVHSVTDILQEGDEVLVKVTEIDPSGKIRLSRKAALLEHSVISPEPTEQIEA